MKNCRDRLQLIYPGTSQFNLGKDEKGGAWICMSIPLELSEANSREQ